MELSPSFFGALAALAGNVCIGISQFLQKVALNRLSENPKPIPRYKDVGWILGFLLSFLGEAMGNFVALSFTSAAVVAPLGAMGILVSGFLANRFLEEKLSRRNRRGYVLLILGVLVVLAIAPKESDALTSEELLLNMGTLAFRFYMIFLISTGSYLAWELSSEKKQRLYKFVLIASLLGSLTTMCGKATSVFLRLTLLDGKSQLNFILPYVMVFFLIVTAFLQEFYKQVAIGRYDSTKFFPPFFASFNFFTATLSLILYPLKMSIWQFMTFYSIAILLIVQGCIDTQKSATGPGPEKEKELGFLESMQNLIFRSVNGEEHTRPE